MRTTRIAALALCGGCATATVAVQPVAGGPAPALAPERPKTVLVERGHPAPAPIPTDGLEAKPGWRAADLAQWKGANPSQASYVDHAASGKLLLVRWKGEGGDKAAIGRVADLSLPSAGRIRFRTYSYVDRKIGLALGVFVGDDRLYYETVRVDVPPKKWTDHSFDLAVPNFKCAASQWEHAAKLGQPDKVREMIILVYDGDSGSLYVDALLPADQ